MNPSKLTGIVILTVCAVVLASALPLIFPYVLCVFALVVIGRVVWFYTR